MRKNFNLPSLRARLVGSTGPTYWRSLEELANTEEFQEFLQREFPQGAERWLDSLNRRNFLKLMAASLALGGLAACSPQSAEKILPYVTPPEEVVPGGEPLFFATAMQLGGIATGLLAESHSGRPTKIEGHPGHPASLGATNIFHQASILNLYDPDRSQITRNAGQVSTWQNFQQALTGHLEGQQGAGLRLLTGTITSPSLADRLQAVLDQFPQAQWHQYEPINRDNARRGAWLAFGEEANPVYRFDRAAVILALEADFLGANPAGVRYAHDFSQKRQVRADRAEMNRLYVVESTPSVTGSMADHRLPLRAGHIESFIRALALAVGLEVQPPPAADSLPQPWLEALAHDQGQGLVLVGESQPPIVHALAHAINERLGNTNQAVIYTDPPEANPVNQGESLQQLAADMAAGAVETLIMIDVNPAYEAPAELDFAGKLGQVGFTVHMGLYNDETAALCQWHLPASHSVGRRAGLRWHSHPDPAPHQAPIREQDPLRTAGRHAGPGQPGQLRDCAHLLDQPGHC